MGCDAEWSRRQFVTKTGLAGAAAMLPVGSTAVPAATMRAAAEERPYALHLTHSRVTQTTVQNSIVTMTVAGERWTAERALELPMLMKPEMLTLHPVLPVIYVAHGAGASVDGLPRGWVAAYALDAGAGGLRAMGGQRLALSVLAARDLAVSPDGRWLVVASGVSGVYCVLPLAQDGTIGPVEHVLKMMGGERHGERPYLSRVLFHPAGVAYGTDSLVPRLHVISFEDGVPTVSSRVALPPGSGPKGMALLHDGDALFVAMRHRSGIAELAVEARTGSIVGGARIERLEGNGGGVVAVSADGGRVYAATQEDGCATASHGGSATLLSVFAREQSCQRLRLVERVRMPEILDARQLVVHGDELLVVGLGGVVAMNVERGAGRLERARHVVRSGPFSDALVQVL